MNTYKRTTLLATGAVVMLLTGCAADPRLGLDGKAGYVTEYYSRDRLRNAPPRCLASLTSEQIATGTYAEINIRTGRGNRYVSALVPSSIKPALHDKVEISPPSCKDGVVPVVRQILSETAPSDSTPKGQLSQGKKQ